MCVGVNVHTIYASARAKWYVCLHMCICSYTRIPSTRTRDTCACALSLHQPSVVLLHVPKDAAATKNVKKTAEVDSCIRVWVTARFKSYFFLVSRCLYWDFRCRNATPTPLSSAVVAFSGKEHCWKGVVHCHVGRADDNVGGNLSTEPKGNCIFPDYIRGGASCRESSCDEAPAQRVGDRVYRIKKKILLLRLEMNNGWCAR